MDSHIQLPSSQLRKWKDRVEYASALFAILWDGVECVVVEVFVEQWGSRGIGMILGDSISDVINGTSAHSVAAG